MSKTIVALGSCAIAVFCGVVAEAVHADTPEIEARLNRYGELEGIVGRKGAQPVVTQAFAPEKSGREVQRIVIGRVTIVIHDPTNEGIPTHSAPVEGTVHGCHQWVYVPPNWVLVHC
ncbi:MAG: hypothetical protein QY320_11440 [Gammaproteobacteria bacterium]|nr:MAG: hypothetical protein QY320_11440 [Gammaproteobacteria bacterium]